MMFLGSLLALMALVDSAATTQQEATPVAAPQQASVTVRLEISELGAADKCEVIATDAPAKLADGICPIFMSKAKFKPKIDDNGKAQRQTLTQTVKFVIQN